MKFADLQDKTFYIRKQYKYSSPEPVFVIDASSYYTVKTEPVYETEEYTVEISPGIHDVREREVRTGVKRTYVKTATGKAIRYSSNLPGILCMVLVPQYNNEADAYEARWRMALVPTRQIFEGDPWEAQQAIADRRKAEVERQAREEREKAEHHAARAAVIERLKAAGITDRDIYNPTYQYGRSLSLTLEEIERLLDRVPVA